MTFDVLVTQFEERLLPSLRQEEALARACGHYIEVEVVSLRHADVVHSIGIRCHPKWASGKLESLSFGVTLTGVECLAASAQIQWSDCFDTRIGSGYQKRETRPVYLRITNEDDIASFVDNWNELVKRFAKIARRGKPSSRLLRWWRGAPPDRFGRKAED